MISEHEIRANQTAVLFELAGRCLVRYQRIERALKLMLPHLHKPGTDIESHVSNWREFLDSKHTLGTLMARFASGTSLEEPEAALAYLEQVVADRNDLVHHFFTSGVLSGAP